MNSHKQDLLDLRRILLDAQETGDDAEQTVELDQTRVGRLSRMDAMQAQAMSIETGNRRRQQLRRIERALKKFDEGDYGTCEECGEDIAPGRLKADPAVQTCISCASASEN